MKIGMPSQKIFILLCAFIVHLTLVYNFSFTALHLYFWIYIFLFYMFLSGVFILKYVFFRNSQSGRFVFFILGPYFSSVLADMFVMIIYFFDFFTGNILNNLIGVFFVPYIALCAWFVSIVFLFYSHITR